MFSAIGFNSREIRVGTRTNVDVELVSIESALDEVVVVAYGTAKRGSFTGSAVQLDSARIGPRPITSVVSALDGAAPGIQVAAANGQPGSTPAVRIRGFGSINASNDPLYVVDGVPYAGSISNLNPQDIETMTVLKDAASAAIYGSRAANGVIMITTKKGRSDKGRFEINATQGFISRAIPEYDRVGPAQYYPLMWEAYRNSLAYSASTPLPLDQASQIASGLVTGRNGIVQLLGYNAYNVPANQLIDVNGQLNPSAQLLYPDDLDWMKPLMRQGKRSDYTASYSGAGARSDYFVSLGYLKEQGFIVRSDFERITGRININTRPMAWFRTGLNLSGALNTSNQASTGSSTGYVNPFFFARNMGPIYPVYAHNMTTGEYLLDARGERIYDLGNLSAQGLPTRASGGSPGRHVVAETMLNKNLYKRNVLSARTYGEVTFLKNFRFTTNISADLSSYLGSDYDNTLVGDGAPAGRASKTNAFTTTINFNQLLNYSKTFGQHNVEVLLGHENYKYTYNYLYGARQGVIAEGNTELINFTTTNSLSSYTDNYRTEGYFSRINYDYDNRYSLSGSYRRDGSSRFSTAARWGNFWSVGFGWRLDQEGFIRKRDWINVFKLRGSYGQSGNDAIGTYYAYQALYGLGYNNALEPGYLQSSLANNNLVWETNTSADLGLDFSFFRQRVTGSVEYFNRQSSNLLFDVPLPVSSGIVSQTRNIGSMYNRGWELQLSFEPFRTQHFSWELTFNATTLQNRVTKLPQNEIIRGTQKLMVGRSIYEYWLRDYKGVDPDNGNAVYRADRVLESGVKVIRGDSVTNDINNARYAYLGTAIPDVYGSLNNTFRFRGFELQVQTNYQLGGKIYDAPYASLMGAGNYGVALHTDMLRRWQKPGDVTDVPRMDNARISQFGAASDRWLADASYFSIRNVTLGYTLPGGVASRIGAERIRIFASGENLAFFSSRKGMNVTQGFTGVSSNAFLPARVLSAGLNIGF